MHYVEQRSQLSEYTLHELNNNNRLTTTFMLTYQLYSLLQLLFSSCTPTDHLMHHTLKTTGPEQGTSEKALPSEDFKRCKIFTVKMNLNTLIFQRRIIFFTASTKEHWFFQRLSLGLTNRQIQYLQSHQNQRTFISSAVFPRQLENEFPGLMPKLTVLPLAGIMLISFTAAVTVLFWI